MEAQVKRNFAWGVIHEGLWGVSFGLINPFTVMQQVLVELGGDARGAGMLAGFMFASLNAPQLFSAFLIPPSWTSPKRVAAMHLPAIAMVALAAAILYEPFGFDPRLKAPAYLGVMTAFFLGIGVLVPHWIACFGRAIPSGILGRFFGSAFGLAGLTGIFGGLLAQHWITAGGLNWGYAACFALAVPFQLASLAALSFTRPLSEEPTPAGRLKEYIKEQWGNIRHNRTFQIFGIVAMLMQLTTASGALFTAYLNTRGEAEGVVSLTTASIQSGVVAGALLLGWLEDKRGPRSALSLAFSVFCLALLWINLDLGLKLSTASFAGVGFFNSAYPVVTTYLVLTLAPKGRQLVYTGLFNTLMAPWCLTPILLGWMAERFSYEAAFTVSATAAIFGILFLTLFKEFGRTPPHVENA